MQRMPEPRGITSCRRGASLIEYILLIGAVALIVFGTIKLFGSRMKDKIEGQSDSVASLDGPDGPSNGASKSGAGSTKGAPTEAGGKIGGGSRTGSAEGAGEVKAGGEVAAGSKVGPGVPAAGGEVVTISNEPPSDTLNAPAFHFGWVLIGVGSALSLAVFLKGLKDKRQMEAEREAEGKKA